MSSSDENASDANASDNASNASDTDASNTSLGEVVPFFRSPDVSNRDVPTVIYIHGIAGQDFQTWDATPSIHFEDLLAGYVDARTDPKVYGVSSVIMFTYDTKRLFSEPERFRQNLEAIALEFLESVQRQDVTIFDPLVMIAHDIGGVIAKLAILLAREYTRFRSIAIDTFGFIFFATPQTMDATKWEEVLIDLSVAVRDEQINQIPLSTSFKEAAIEFANITTQFGGIINDYRFFYFYQDPYGESTNSYRIIVPKDIAIMDQRQERVVARRQSHFNLCKFMFEDDQIQHIGDYVLDGMEGFFFDPYRMEYFRFLESITPKHGPAMLFPRWDNSNPSFEWIFSDEVFEAWSSSAQPSILHIHAVHGAGKTAMSQFLAWRLGEKGFGKGTAVATFWFNSTGFKNSTIDDMCHSLIAQLLLSIRHVYGALYQIYDNLSREIKTEDLDHGAAMGEPSGWAILRAILSYNLPEQIFIIIDAIDECRGNYSNALKALVEQLKIMTSTVKIIITSASGDESTRDSLSGCFNISLDEREAMQVAAHTTIDAAIDDLVHRRPALQSFRAEICQRVCETRPLNVQNAGLKIKYILGSRLQSTPRSVRSVLDQVTKSPLETAFDDALDITDLGVRDWSLRALSWMIYAFRPLRVTELATALAISDWKSSCDPTEELLSRDPQADLDDALGILISIKDGVVHFAHPKIKTLAEKYVRENQKAGSDESLNHRTIARICLGYLSDKRVNDALEALRVMTYQPGTSLVDSTESTLRFGLVLYAAQYWPAHYRCREVNLKEDTDYTIEYLSSKAEWFKLDHFSTHRILRLPFLFELIPFLIPAYLGLSDVVADKLNPESANYLKSSYDIRDLFTSAARGNDVDTLKLFKGHPDIDQDTISDTIVAALIARAPEAIQLLFGDFEIPFSDGWLLGRLLTEATNAGQTEIVREILKFEGDVPFQHESFLRAVRAAASMNLGETLSQLLEVPTLHKWADETDLESEVDIVEENEDEVAEEGKEPAGNNKEYKVTENGEEQLTNNDEDQVTEKGKEQVEKSDDNTYDIAQLKAIAMRAAVQSGQKPIVDTLADDKDAILEIDSFGRSTIHIACVLGYKDFVSLLVKEGTVDHKDENQRTALHHAAAHGSIHVVQTLLDAGADINATDSNGETPLALAGIFKRPHMVKLLSEKGADTAMKNKYGDSILQSALGNKSSAIAQALVNKDNLEIIDGSEVTPLLYAIRMRSTKIAMILVDFGANIEARAPNGATALLMAVYKRMSDLTKFLLEKGANSQAQDDTGRTALHRAAQKGDLASLEAVLKYNTEVNVKDKMQRTPLHHGALSGSRDCVKCLLHHQAETDAADESNKTAIELASDGPGHEIGCLILKNSPNDKVDESILQRLFHNAAMAGDLDAVKLITDRSSDVVEMVNSKNNSSTADSAIYDAVTGGSKAVVEFILSQGADLNLTVNDKRGPLYQAVTNKRLDIIQILLEKETDVNRFHGKERNPFHAAVLSKSSEIVRLLIKHGADMNCLDPAMMPPLQLASYDVEITRILLENGADVHQNNGTMHAMTSIFQNYYDDETCSPVLDLYFKYGVEVDEVDSRGMTAMHWAALLGHLKYVKLFLEKNKSTLEQKDKQGRSTIHFAASANRHEVLAFVLDELNLQSLKDIKLGDIDGWTPLHWSCKNFSAETWAILADRGIDVSQTALNGWTAEHVANYHATAWEFGRKVLGKGASLSPPPQSRSPSPAEPTGSGKASPGHGNDRESDRNSNSKIDGHIDDHSSESNTSTSPDRVESRARDNLENNLEADTSKNGQNNNHISTDAATDDMTDEDAADEDNNNDLEHDAQSIRSRSRSARSKSQGNRSGGDRSIGARSPSVRSGSGGGKDTSRSARSVSRSSRTRTIGSVASDTFYPNTGLPKFAASQRNSTCAHCLTDIFGPQWTCSTHDSFYYLCFKCGWHRKQQHEPDHKWTLDIKKRELLPTQDGKVLTKEEAEALAAEDKKTEEATEEETEKPKNKEAKSSTNASTSGKASSGKGKNTQGKKYRISTRPKYKGRDERRESVRSAETDSEDGDGESESVAETSSSSENDVVVTGRRGRQRL